MALAHTRPSLLGRIDAKKHGFITLSTSQSGIQKPVVGTFSERYRGTEFGQPVSTVRLSEPSVSPPVSRGRLFMLGSATAATVVLGVLVAAVPA